MSRIRVTGLLVATLFAVASARADTWITARMGGDLEEVTAYLQTLAPASECTFGHVEAPERAYPPMGGLDVVFRLLKARPFADCPQCARGFRVHTIHLLTYVPQPVQLDGWVNLRDPLFPIGSCVTPVPGPNSSKDCEARYSVVIDEPGFYDVAISIDCPCAVNSYPYFVGFDSAWWPYALFDDACTRCAGWYLDHHTVDYPWREHCDPVGIPGAGEPGDILYYAEADCCEQPIPDDRSSWGTLKALFGR